MTSQSRRIRQLMSDLVVAQRERDLWREDAEHYRGLYNGVRVQLKTLEAQIKQMQDAYEVNPHG